MTTPRKRSAAQPAAAGGVEDRRSDRPDATRAAAILLEDPPEPESFYTREEWRLACRVAASKGLSKSDLLPRFLLHVCELALCGRAHEITEQRIGTHIFNRPPDYNPGEDNIVRSYARIMRKRLDDYFTGEGRHEPLRIAIPRGGYVPVFEPAGADDEFTLPAGVEPAAVEPEPLPHAAGHASAPRRAGPGWAEGAVGVVPATAALPVARRPWLRWRHEALLLLAGLLLGGLAVAGWLRRTALPPHSAAHAIWSQIFEPTRDTLIVPADSGLGILENLSKRSVTVEQYANGSYLQEMASAAGVDSGNFNDLGRQRYTSVVDLDIAARIIRLPEYIDNRAQIRYARSVSAEDIKGSNAILIGSRHTDPWVALFEPSMYFTLEFTPQVDRSYIVDHAARGAEPVSYANGSPGSGSPTYGVIAYLPGLDGSGHVLIVEGLNMAATQAAAEVLFNEKAIVPVLEAAALPNGNLRPFELLVRTSSVGATSPGAQILLTRLHNP